MFFIFYILSVTANILIQLQPNEPCTIYFTLDKDGSDIQVKLAKLDPDAFITYYFKKDEKHFDDSSSYYEEDYFVELTKDFSTRIEKKGNYKLIILNRDSYPSSVNFYSQLNNPTENKDSDVLAIKKLFSDIENKLISLYNGNMRLKTMQDKNILEAKRIIKGLYVMFLLPIIYFLVGFIKVRATKSMFAPKKGLKP
ncbi:hypothetical protein NGRA_2483 [Nosema granulosis]|uniref:Vesicle transport v-snare protein n=1 Tax=Nosema granulosis TaxID=83296 RepID=A0A9P6KYK7_9MICR|nr:hypothetical protein NGRA_2483 [Nosema granulosis]